MAKFPIFMLFAAALFYVGVCGVLYLLQRSFLYFPTPEVDHTDAEAIYLDNDIARIKIWKAGSGNERAILYFGGNAEQVAQNITPFLEHLPGHDIYLMNYRGYGGSTGAPSETALYIDALALYDHVAEVHESVSIIGRSLGSGIATYVAANRDVEKLALITPYDSIENIAKSTYPLVPVSLLLHDKYDSAALVHRIDSATLIITAENDSVIPKRFTEALIESFDGASLETREIPGTHHQTVSNPPVFWDILGGFFADGA